MEQNKIKINLNDADKIKRFIRVARDFVSDIDIVSDTACIDGKSILGLHTLDLSKDVYARIISDNTEEIRRFDALMEEFK